MVSWLWGRKGEKRKIVSSLCLIFFAGSVEAENWRPQTLRKLCYQVVKVGGCILLVLFVPSPSSWQPLSIWIHLVLMRRGSSINLVHLFPSYGFGFMDWWLYYQLSQVEACVFSIAFPEFQLQWCLKFCSKSQIVPLWVVFDRTCFNFLDKSNIGLYLVAFTLSCLLCLIVLRVLASFYFINEKLCFHFKENNKHDSFSK